MSVLVISCDRYSDLWKPFFGVFRKRWPDCPYPVYLGANHCTCDDPEVTTLAIGEDTSWTAGVRAMLERIGSPQVIVMLEDFLLTRAVDTPGVERLVAIAREHDVTCLRMRCATPPSAAVPEHADLGVLRPGDSYRVSTQMAVWKTEHLRLLTLPEFSAWQFEELGTHISNRLPWTFWGVRQTLVHYLHGVERGKWRPEGLDICRQAGVEVDLQARPAMTPEDLEAYLRVGRRHGLLNAVIPQWLLRFVRLHRHRRAIDRHVADIMAASDG